MINENLPEDWKEQIINSKVDHDKYDIMCTVIVLPISWREGIFNSKIPIHYINGDVFLYGSKIMFGSADKPVCASDFSLWFQIT